MRILSQSVAVLVLAGGALALACSSKGSAAGASTSSGGSATSTGSSGAGTTSTTSTSGTTAGTSTSSSGTPPAGPDANALIPSDALWWTKTEWYRPVDGAPTTELSDEMIGTLKKWGLTDVFQIDFSFSVLDGTGGTPTTFPLEEEADDVPVPIPAKGYVEGDHAYTDCPQNEDCHILVVEPGAKKLFEVYQAHKNGAAWSGYVALWKLDKAYPRTNRGAGCTSADAAGLPITPGLIGYKETKAGAIKHALRFIIRNEFIRGVAGDKNVPNNVYPASHGSTAGDATTGIPYGARLRLKSTFSETDARVKSPGAKAIVKALKTYGMILADGGNLPLVAESVKVHADKDPAATWDGTLAPRDLGFLRPGDFEVVAIPKGDPSEADAGWYQTKADYVGQLKKPLGCTTIVQP